MPHKWTHVRIKAETREAMHRFRQERIDMDYPLPASECPRWDSHTSDDGVIRYLLAQVAEHRRRAHQSRARKAHARLVAKGQAVAEEGGPQCYVNIRSGPAASEHKADGSTN